MLKIRNYNIYFKHKPDEWGYTISVLNGRNVETAYKGITYCHVELDGEVISTGVAYCGLADRFDKPTGRKISIGRAIKGLDEGFRKEVWDSYFKLARKPKAQK